MLLSTLEDYETGASPIASGGATRDATPFSMSRFIQDSWRRVDEVNRRLPSGQQLFRPRIGDPTADQWNYVLPRTSITSTAATSAPRGSTPWLVGAVVVLVVLALALRK